jgi:hypothetical protein
VTPRYFAKSAGLAIRPRRYPIVSLLSVGGEGGFYGYSLKTAGACTLRQLIRCSGVLVLPQEQVSLASLWLYLV